MEKTAIVVESGEALIKEDWMSNNDKIMTLLQIEDTTNELEEQNIHRSTNDDRSEKSKDSKITSTTKEKCKECEHTASTNRNFRRHTSTVHNQTKDNTCYHNQYLI